ncbi:hypothetical protein B0T26DRAFT_743157 [Lasiosphaeria miniovina]|uniref:HNH nuclease domain-containing protein n=1 Tax=Lasiosphaeria miniovina TaxID=1954250 RepID=A0AA40A5P1_9PEZI|nr:uncharacterized protein B0T26DRAFT_743157 [Lasiosphaeria miniovina]KAK0709811.1 hypothetical protein B0T26DRAFT_743157 [Lasiosphaeria miniovina]
MATTAPPLQTQCRRPKPGLELPSRDDICFRHPGYSQNSLLIALPRVDSTRSISPYGLHHRTALLACQIIARNAFANSYLSLDKGVNSKSRLLYPIVPSFQDWEFPHDRIPDYLVCGITIAGYAVEEAHLVPKEEKRWYQENEMRTYTMGDINNQGNLLPMRKDIHYWFNTRWFIIVPKIVTIDSSLQLSLQYVTHIISGPAAELWPTYHNTLVESLHFRSRAYLFARFACAILFQAKLFVTAGQDRQVIQVSRDKFGNVEYKTKYCTGEDLENAYGGGGSKTATPRTLEVELRTALRQIIPQQGVASED